MSGTADLNIRGVAWAIDTSALDLQVDYSVGLVSVKTQGAVPLRVIAVTACFVWP